MGKPSGMAATAKDTLILNISINGRPETEKKVHDFCFRRLILTERLNQY